MTKFLIIGPSGIGKTSALNILLKDDSIEIYDLDCLIKENVRCDSVSTYFAEFGNENFFNKSKEIIDNLNRDKIILIAVGAGSIDFEGGNSWFEKQNLIALTGDPEIIYNRSNRQKFHFDLEKYIASEYSTRRNNLYRKAKYSIDVTYLNSMQVSAEIAKTIKNHC